MDILKDIENSNYFIIFRNGTAIGDHLLITSVIDKIKNYYSREIIVYTMYPELFKNNHKIYKIFNYKKSSDTIRKFLRRSNSKYILNFRHNWTYEKEKKSLPEWHTTIIKEISFKNCCPEIFLSSQEIEEYKNKFNLPDKYYIIQSQSKRNKKKNKDWGYGNFQNVVNVTNSQIKWIQIGSKNEKKLKNVHLNLCGKTTLRELFYIISKSYIVLSNDGVLSHISAAFNIKNICIISPVTYPELLPYKNIIHVSCYDNLNLHKPCLLCEKWYCNCNCNCNWRKNIELNKVIKLLK
jgi:ADP-heptose:LPS heptosyltransferase